MIDWRLLGRLPARFWVQLVLGLVLLGVLAAFGFALLLGGALFVLGVALVAQLMAWFRGSRPRPYQPDVIDGEYQVVEQKKTPAPPRAPDI
ncbi:MAG: hypothetical protein AB7R90_06475 [Reyranellaceae bacterium]